MEVKYGIQYHAKIIALGHVWKFSTSLFPAGLEATQVKQKSFGIHNMNIFQIISFNPKCGSEITVLATLLKVPNSYFRIKGQNTTQVKSFSLESSAIILKVII